MNVYYMHYMWWDLNKILNLNLNLLCRYIFLSSITQKTLTSRDWVPMPASYKKQEQISPRGHLYFLISVFYLFCFYISILFSVPNVAWVPKLFFLGCPFCFPYRLLTRLKIKPKWPPLGMISNIFPDETYEYISFIEFGNSDHVSNICSWSRQLSLCSTCLFL